MSNITRTNPLIGTQESVYSNTIGKYKYYKRLCSSMKPYNFDKETLEKLYASGMSLRDISKRFNCYPDTIYDYFVKYNIQMRRSSRIASLLIKNERAKFVENLNPQWIVGFVDGEGSFIFRREQNQRRIYPVFSISQRNVATLNKINSCFPTLLWLIRKSPATTAYNLRVTGFKESVKLFWFFDKYPPIEKYDQYHIWKFLISQLISNDYSWEIKEKIWKLYKTEKNFAKFKSLWREGQFLHPLKRVVSLPRCL